MVLDAGQNAQIIARSSDKQWRKQQCVALNTAGYYTALPSSGPKQVFGQMSWILSIANSQLCRCNEAT